MAWSRNRLTELLGIEYPIVQAPMASVTTPELVASVSNAGGLGSLGAAMLAPDALRDAIGAIRSLTDRPFGVNLFAWPQVEAAPPGAVEAMRDALRPFRERFGVGDPEPRLPDVRRLLEDQLAVLAEERPPVFSFTFGIPDLGALGDSGSVVMGTATTVAEARALEQAGVDAIVAQGSEAGGHRGTFLGPFESALVGAMALVPQVVDAVSIPVMAAGGIMDGRGIAAALALGADGAQLGTAFVAAAESGVPAAHKQAIAEIGDDGTVVTDRYSGRPARVARTQLLDALERSGLAVPPFPLQSALTRDLHAAAVDCGDREAMFLLAGQGAPLTRALPAAELVADLVAETETALGVHGAPARD
jgi:nitronate monooxygenase